MLRRRRCRYPITCYQRRQICSPAEQHSLLILTLLRAFAFSFLSRILRQGRRLFVRRVRHLLRNWRLLYRSLWRIGSWSRFDKNINNTKKYQPDEQKTKRECKDVLRRFQITYFVGSLCSNKVAFTDIVAQIFHGQVWLRWNVIRGVALAHKRLCPRRRTDGYDSGKEQVRFRRLLGSGCGNLKRIRVAWKMTNAPLTALRTNRKKTR